MSAGHVEQTGRVCVTVSDQVTGCVRVHRTLLATCKVALVTLAFILLFALMEDAQCISLTLCVGNTFVDRKTENAVSHVTGSTDTCVLCIRFIVNAVGKRRAEVVRAAVGC